MTTTTLSLALAAATLVVSGAAQASQSSERTIAVAYYDLDLATQAGQAELERRLDRAARQVCSLDQPVTGTRIPTRDARQCFTQARRQLDRQLAQAISAARLGG